MSKRYLKNDFSKLNGIASGGDGVASVTFSSLAYSCSCENKIVDENRMDNNKLERRRNSSFSAEETRRNSRTRRREVRPNPEGEETPPPPASLSEPGSPRGHGAQDDVPGLVGPFMEEVYRTAQWYRDNREFWNNFPKTDYVYSPSSPWYGMEIAPGIPLMPNMTRRSLRSRFRSSGTFNADAAASLNETHEPLACRIEESWYLRIRRVVRTSVTYVYRSTSVAVTSVSSPVAAAVTSIASPVAAAASSVAATGTSALATAAATVTSTVTSVAATATSAVTSKWAGTSLTEQISRRDSRWTPWLLFLLFLILPAAIYFAFYGTDPPTQSFPIKVSLGSLPMYFEYLSSPYVRLLNGAADLGSLFVRSLLMIPSFIVEIFSLFDGTHPMYAEERDYAPWNIDPKPMQVAVEGTTQYAESSRKYSEEDMEHLRKYVESVIQEKMNDAKKKQDRDVEKLLEMHIQHLIKNSAMTPKVEETDKKLLHQESASEKESFERDVASLVQRLLDTYHADRTGKPDYALSSNGAAIASIRCTRPYSKQSAEYVLLGIFHWEYANSPDIIIRPGHMPGECWAFEGANGYVAIQLAIPIYVTGFSMEHTPKELALLGHIQSAPKKFSVWGLTSLEDNEEEFLGRFEFQDDGSNLQSFEAVVVDRPFGLVELRVESNHGHPEYTCLYRFRVHGKPAA